ncbi:MAG TPA: hypothetical protein VH482_20925 [Thermomicrobiales bacterium]
MVTKLGQEGRRYRVEHRESDRTRVLAIVTDVFPHRTTLVPYASRLLREGMSGQVVLLDDASDAVVATYRLASGMKRRNVFRSRPRPPGTEDLGDQPDRPPRIGGVNIDKRQSA